MDNEDTISCDINDFGSILELFNELSRSSFFKYAMAYPQYICIDVISGAGTRM